MEAEASDHNDVVWVLRLHNRVTLREAHAVIHVDEEKIQSTICGLKLHEDETTGVPSRGSLVCESCVLQLARRRARQQ